MRFFERVSKASGPAKLTRVYIRQVRVISAFRFILYHTKKIKPIFAHFTARTPLQSCVCKLSPHCTETLQIHHFSASLWLPHKTHSYTHVQRAFHSKRLIAKRTRAYTHVACVSVSVCVFARGCCCLCCVRPTTTTTTHISLPNGSRHFLVESLRCRRRLRTQPHTHKHTQTSSRGLAPN